MLWMLAAALANPWTPTWTAATDGWNGGVAIAPTGEVVIAEGGDLTILDPRDGHPLRTVDACDPAGESGLAFAGDRLVVVCDDEALAFAWPGLARTTLATFPRQIEVAAIRGPRIAVAEDAFWIRDGAPAELVVYEAGKVIDRVTLGVTPEGVAFSPDGRRVYYGVEGQGIQVRDLTARTTARLPHPTLRPNVLAVSPDGKRLFAEVDSFSAAILDADTGAELGRWRVGSWITAARFVGDAVIATGSDGLAWFAAGYAPVPLADASGAPDTGEGLDATADGLTACAGDRDGRIVCFTRDPSRPVAAPVVTTTPNTTTSTSSAAVPVERPTAPAIEGTVTSIRGETVVVTLPAGTAGAVGGAGSLEARFETNIGFSLSGWMSAADVTIARIDGTSWTLTITKRTANITVNGAAVDPLKVGGTVRLTLHR